MSASAVTTHEASFESPGAIHAIPVQATINEYGLVCIILSAIESGTYGISYWCPRVELRKTDRVVIERLFSGDVDGEYVARNVALGGELSCYERESETGEGVWHTLDREKLLKGVGRWMANGGNGRPVGTEEDGSLSFDIDGPAADVIIQYALLGEVRYG